MTRNEKQFKDLLVRATQLLLEIVAEDTRSEKYPPEILGNLTKSLIDARQIFDSNQERITNFPKPVKVFVPDEMLAKVRFD